MQQQAAIDAVFAKAESAGRAELTGAEILEVLNLAGIEAREQPGAAGVPLFVGLRGTREFGMVINAGLGGAGLDQHAAAFRKGQAMATASTRLIDADDFLKLFQRGFAYKQLAGAVSDAQLRDLFAALIDLGNRYAPDNAGVERALEELVLHPAMLAGGKVAVGAANCRIGKPGALLEPKPIAKIGNLLHPKTIGLIGASATKMNFGRIILKNLIANGYSRDQMVIIRPGEEEIDGVKCVESLKALGYKLDLFVVAVAADAVFDLVDEIIETDAAEAVMLIPGGLGETQKSVEPSARMRERINAAHKRPGGGPVFLGGNCLGVVSHPGAYDSWFIPQERLPKTQKKARRNSALISQSGAFMITRLSRNPWLDPNYMVALGNQSDLTHGDMIAYFADNAEIDAIGIYVEGFRDLDGLAFARGVRKAVLKGKQIVVYKAGRTSAGGAAALGHTASTAGDYAVCEAVLTQAGAMVAKDLTEFDDLFHLANMLHDKKINGNRLAAVSGAGFETVGMADSIRGENFSLAMAPLAAGTTARLGEILAAKKLDALMEVRNPFDINPGADDETHVLCAEAMIADPNVDAVVVGLDPASPAMRTLDKAHRAGFDIHSEESVVKHLPKLATAVDKPIVGIVDGGSLYDPMVEKLQDQGVCVFRSCERGVEALVGYMGARLYAAALQRKYK